MTTKRAYECNLCDGVVTDESGHGVDYDMGKITLRRVREAEVHLCKYCTNMLAEILAPKPTGDPVGWLGSDGHGPVVDEKKRQALAPKQEETPSE